MDLASRLGRLWRFWWMRALATLLLVALVGLFFFVTVQPVKVLPRIRVAPGFLLVDQDGQPLSSEDLRGTVVLYGFAYSRCDLEACRQTEATLRAIQEGLPARNLEGMSFRILTLSLDPVHDTPEALRAYARRVGADPAVWRFATVADPALLRAVVGGGFEVYYEPQADGSIRYDPVFLLVDGWGVIRAEYRYQTLLPQTERILWHLEVLASEVRNSRGVGKLAYEAAHLFSCYAR